MIKTILFVCTGNTCRSIMAQGIFEKLLKEKTESPHQFNVMSAGICAMPGMIPTPEAISVMSEKNIDISKHESKQLTKDLIDKADYIFTMSNNHLNYLLNINPSAQSKAFLLKRYAIKDKIKENIKNKKHYEINDPIGKDIDYYRIIAKEIRENVEKVINIIIKENTN
ncbi:MAG: low molecular weight protein arginine phosphatase [Candidatus Caldatribacteriota bacterium]|nr:low molecular weight protein arginine phosphatase [Candidatus Caldatribacteriota bacterium]